MTKTFRVSEIFGPTLQGEGRQAGLPCYFIRFGGCDLRCSWCDTPYAVLPELVAQLEKLSVAEIINRLNVLPRGPEWVVITGGNPALLQLEDVVDELTQNGFLTMVETQGTIWSDWLADTDEICISPKPPSSGNTVEIGTLGRFLYSLGQMVVNRERKAYLKVVVFDAEDYAYAREIHKRFPRYEMFVSVGNNDPSLPTVGNPNPDVMAGSTRGELRDNLGHNYRVLSETVMQDREMRRVRVLPQLHVIAWGNGRGH